MYATELIEVTRLKPFPVRDIRPSTLEKIKKRITESGYNPARPLSVVKSNGSFLIADGNHRFAVIQELNIDKVPCVVYEEGHDPYAPVSYTHLRAHETVLDIVCRLLLEKKKKKKNNKKRKKSNKINNE